LRVVLTVALERVTRGSGNRLFIIRSGFGGGKTHLIAAVYYLFKGMAEGVDLSGTAVGELVERYGKARARICAVDLTGWDPWKKTLWGWLGECLGKYRAVERFDTERRPPDGVALGELFRVEEPVVILIDEVGEYFRRIEAAPSISPHEKDAYAEAVQGFFRSLYDYLRERDFMIISMPDDSAPYSDWVKRHLNGLERLLRRIGEEKEPITRIDEVYGIINQRIFKRIDEKLRDRAVRAYLDFYRKFAGQFVEEWVGGEELERAFPFHPSLVRTLYERASSIPEFQRARDLIYVLHRAAISTIQGIRRDNFITAGDIDLLEDEFKEFFTTGVGRPSYRAIIDHDLAIAREKGPYHYRAAAALYIYSLIGGDVKRSAADMRAIKTLVAKPGDQDPAIYDNVVKELLEELWYIDTDGQRYWFSAEPNLNKMLEEEAKLVTDADDYLKEEVDKFVRELSKTIGIEVKVFNSKEDVEDAKRFVVYVLGHNPLEISCQNYEALKGRYSAMTYKNSAVFLLHSGLPLHEAAYVSACDKLENEVKKEQKERLGEICDKKRLYFYTRFYGSYNCLLYPTESGLMKASLNLDVARQNDSATLRKELAQLVKTRLEEVGKLMAGLNEEFFYYTYLEPRLGNIDKIDLSVILEDLYRDPSLPLGVKDSDVRTTLEKLATKGKIVLSCRDSYYWPGKREPPFDCDPSGATAVLRELPGDVAVLLKAGERKEEKEALSEICHDLIDEIDKVVGGVTSQLFLEGGDLDNANRAFQRLLAKGFTAESAEAEFTLGNISSSWKAKGPEAVRDLLRYLGILKAQARDAAIKISINLVGSEVSIDREFVDGLKIYSGVKIKAHAKICSKGE
jgi:hypothetical protein